MALRTMSEMKAHIVAKAGEDEDFRAHLIADPRSVLTAELGMAIPEGFDVQVHDGSGNQAYHHSLNNGSLGWRRRMKSGRLQNSLQVAPKSLMVSLSASSG